jgi:hypothetical protein
MAFGFPAYHTDRYEVAPEASARLGTVVRAALEALPWSVKEDRPDRLVASTGLGMRSWGEKVTIEFISEDSISITSTCALPTQCLDWGKNKANVELLMAEIRAQG